MNENLTPPPSLEQAWNLRRDGNPQGAITEQWRIAAEVYGDVGVPGGVDEAKARIAGDKQDLENQEASGA